MGVLRTGDARCGQLRRGQRDRGDGRSRSLAAIGPQVVAHRGRAPCERDRVDLEDVGISPQQAEIQALVENGTINDKLARQVFEGVIAGEGSPAEVVAARQLAIVSDEGALAAAVNEAINANPDIVDKIKSGKVQPAR